MWVVCAYKGLLFEVWSVGLSFPVFDIGVYESFVDGKWGGWELIETVLYFTVRS